MTPADRALAAAHRHAHVPCGDIHGDHMACCDAITAGLGDTRHRDSWTDWTLALRWIGCAAPQEDPLVCVIHRCSPDAPCDWHHGPQCTETAATLRFEGNRA